MSPPSADPPASDPWAGAPPPHPSLYGQPPGAPPPSYGQPYGQGGYDQNQYGQNPYGQSGYDPRFGYGPSGHQQQPITSSTDTNWALFSYLGLFIAGFLAPLIVYLVKKDESPFVRFHAAQALNYTITVAAQMLAALAVAIPIVVVTESPVGLLIAVPVLLVHAVAQWVFLILGAVRSSQGQFWRIPTWTCWPMIR